MAIFPRGTANPGCALFTSGGTDFSLCSFEFCQLIHSFKLPGAAPIGFMGAVFDVMWHRLQEGAIKGCNPEDACGERNAALIYGIVYDTIQVSWDIAEFDCLFTGDPTACSVADYLLPIWIDMDVADLDYNLLTAGGNPQDGFVPTASQNYPSSSAIQYPINHADSHTGATRSTLVRTTFQQALQAFPFSVPTQASCAFSTTTASYPVSSGGGTGSFGLTAGVGCPWSVVSQAPWITITSAANGASSATISFTASSNPQTIPRTGITQIGNGISTVNFSVQQAGVCLYSLSDGPSIAVPSSGGTYAVSVSTGVGCVWSAVSNSTWLTISAGASGTGPGSFSFTAAANSGASDLTGSLSVMTQTLTILIGSPVGTPGTGSVTFSGSPRSTTVNECPNQYPYNCPHTIPEGGNITVSVGSETFSVGYGNSNATPATLAALLASSINQQTLSPIVASVSGGQVIITSTIKGAVTNYPLSTSYTFDTTNFSSPAFTGTASGSSLTGGTD